MIILGAADTIVAQASAATALTITVFGVEIVSGVETFKRLYQGQPGITPTTLYTTPVSTQTLIKTIMVSNPTGSARTIQVWVAGSADANAVLPTITVDAGGFADYDGTWRFYTSTGQLKQGNTAANELTGTVLASNVVSSSLTSVGVLNAGSIAPGFGSINIDASSITAGAASFTTITGSGNLAIGASTLSHIRVYLTGNVIGSASAAFGIYMNPTLIASANNNLLIAQRIDFTATPGAYTSLRARGIYVNGFSVATFSSPDDPAMVEISQVNGTGATNAYGILIAPPTGASNNYLITHTTPATFNVTAAGAITGQAASFTTGTFSAPITVTSATNGNIYAVSSGVDSNARHWAQNDTVSWAWGVRGDAADKWILSSNGSGGWLDYLSLVASTGAATFASSVAMTGSGSITAASGATPYFQLIQTGVVTWTLENNATSGLFAIREAGVANWLTIAKTTGEAVFAGTASFTTLAASGVFTSTAGLNAITVSNAGANQANALIQNTAGSFEVGVFASGKSYLGSTSADDLEIYAHNTKIATLNATQFIVGSSTFVVTAATGAVACGALTASIAGNTPVIAETTGGTAVYSQLKNTGGSAYVGSVNNALKLYYSGAATLGATLDSSGLALTGPLAITGALTGVTTAAANSFTSVYNAGTGLGTVGVSRYIAHMETATVARFYSCGNDASTKGTFEFYNSTSTTPTLALTIGATGAATFANDVTVNNANGTSLIHITQPISGGGSALKLSQGNGTTAGPYNYITLLAMQTTPQEWRFGQYGSDDFTIYDFTATAARLTIAKTTGAATFGGALAITGALTGVTDITASSSILQQKTGTGAALIESYNATSGQEMILLANGTGGAVFGVTASRGGVGTRSNHSFDFIVNSTLVGTFAPSGLSVTGNVDIGNTLSIAAKNFVFGANDSAGAGYRTVTIQNA